MSHPKTKHLAGLTVAALLATGCSSSSGAPPAASSTAAARSALSAAAAAPLASATAPGSSVTSAGSLGSSAATTPARSTSLAGVCPATIVIQTDWYPESEHGEFYQLTGKDAVEDDARKRYTSPLYTPAGQDTGVKIEIRAGGPAIGFQQATAQMYQDPTILISVVAMDQAIQNSAKLPTVAIIAPRKISPQIIMWDPASHPTFKTIADIGKTDTRVLYFGGAAYMDYLTGKGILNKTQVDGSYDGSFASFVASRGRNAQQGYATAEPFQYEHEIKQWAKPVAYQLIADTGFNPFPADAVKPESITKYAPCFARLVPLLQQGEINYLAAPPRVDQLVSTLTTNYGGAPYTAATADYAAKVQIQKGLVGNISGTGLGGIDLAGLKKLIDITVPIFAAQKTKPEPDLTPNKIATNQFIDQTIQLPAQ